MDLVAAHGRAQDPAALALRARGGAHRGGERQVLALHGDRALRDRRRAVRPDVHPRHPQQPPQPIDVGVLQVVEQCQTVLQRSPLLGVDRDTGLQRGADHAPLPGALQRQVRGLAEPQERAEGPQPLALGRPALQRRPPAREEDAGRGPADGQRLPDVLGHVAEHGRQDLGQVLQEPAEHRLAAPAPEAARGRDVEPVLGRVEVEGRELLHELNQELRGAAQAVGRVGLGRLLEGLLGAQQHVLVQQRHVRGRDRVQFGVEVVQVPEQEACPVPELADVLRDGGHDAPADGHVEGEVDRRHPEAQGVGPVSGLLLLVRAALDDRRRIDDVPDGLAHLAAVRVDAEAVRHDAAVGRPAAHSHGGDERGLEPAAVLVLALKVEVHRRPEPVLDRGPGGARVEPDVHGVRAPLVELRVRAQRLGQQLLRGQLPPGVRAALCHEPPHVRHDLGRQQRLARVLPVEGWDGHAPGPLPRDAPVAAPDNHRPHAVRVALGDEGDLVHRAEDCRPETVDAREPLRRGAGDDGLLAPPVVRVLVLVRPLEQKQVAILKHLDDPLVCILQDVRTNESI
mmetsp:Transcript_8242/g.24296  ORF Transcript_8242/g.24296 Transcript_8242/m.24296 type:complete len:568 (-) Transcript_8242:1103-2806(-)